MSPDAPTALARRSISLGLDGLGHRPALGLDPLNHRCSPSSGRRALWMFIRELPALEGERRNPSFVQAPGVNGIDNFGLQPRRAERSRLFVPRLACPLGKSRPNRSRRARSARRQPLNQHPVPRGVVTPAAAQRRVGSSARSKLVSVGGADRRQAPPPCRPVLRYPVGPSPPLSGHQSRNPLPRPKKQKRRPAPSAPVRCGVVRRPPPCWRVARPQHAPGHRPPTASSFAGLRPSGWAGGPLRLFAFRTTCRRPAAARARTRRRRRCSGH